MKYNTRLVPTVNGPLHLGHLYLALVNENEAHSSGGRFTVRFDDNQEFWLKELGMEKVNGFREKMRDELSAFMTVDAWTSQLEDYSKDHDRLMDAFKAPVPDALFFHSHVPDWRPHPGLTLYPYAPHFTAEKVILDHLEIVNWLIRGIDLVSEFSLYAYFEEQLGVTPIKQTYLPRLLSDTGEEISPISKTLGNQTIGEWLRRARPEIVLEVLAESCLVNPEAGWFVSNVKKTPMLKLWSKKKLGSS
jgi:hypothetical protein